MVWVNGPRDLENRVNSEKIHQAQIDNMQRGMNYLYTGSNKKTIPYQTLVNNNRQYESGHQYFIPK